MRIEARNQLKRIRMAKGFGQQDIADKLKVTKSFYNQIENQVKFPSPKRAKKICHLLGVNFDDIFFVSDDNDNEREQEKETA